MKVLFRFLLPAALIIVAGPAASASGSKAPPAAVETGGKTQPTAVETGGKTQPAVVEAGSKAQPEIIGLDAALAEGSAYIAGKIPPGKTKIAVLGIDAETHELSEHIMMELRQYFQRDHGLQTIERRFLGRLIDEWGFQASSGVVDENRAVSIGNAEDAEIIVFGTIAAQGKEYRLTLVAMDVKAGTSFDYREPVRLPENLIPPPADGNMDLAIDRAVYALGKDIPGKINISMGRISILGYPSVTDFSRYLNDRITESALRRDAKYRVDARKTQATGATLEGHYSILNDEVEVTLQLVSTSQAETVMGSSRFTVSDREIKRRNLALLPVQGDAQVSRESFERQQRVIAPYSGENNPFSLSAEPDHANGIYHDGERMRFTVQSERDCYIQISYVDVFGNFQILFPVETRDLRYNFVRAGTSWTVPEYLNLTLGLPAGEEYVLIAAFENQFEVEDEGASSQQAAPERISAPVVNQSMKARAIAVNRTPEGQVIRQQVEAESVAATRFCYQIARPQW
ncbi:MAG: DUF4384 domain-containing protein [Treponema sp.]|jgi:hypothetical protein|nr:DUF4384 domain-containing protein [Treponema sp.]